MRLSRTLKAEPFVRYVLIPTDWSCKKCQTSCRVVFDLEETSDRQYIEYVWESHLEYMRSRGVISGAVYEVTPGTVSALYDVRELQPVFHFSFTGSEPFFTPEGRNSALSGVFVKSGAPINAKEI